VGDPARLGRPGSRANVDHLVIGPGGVFVIDSKQYRGRLQMDPSGRLWRGRYPLAPTVRAASFEADRAAQVLPDPGMAVVPIVAVHGAQVPWGKVVIDGVPVVPAKRLPDMLRQLPAVLGPERVAWLADQARLRFHAAAWPQSCTAAAGKPNSSLYPSPSRAASAPGSGRDGQPTEAVSGGSGNAPSARAAWLASFAALPVSLRSAVTGRVGPYARPYAVQSRTLRGSVGGFVLVMSPRGSGADRPSGCASRV
jgi:hypothetical protein